MFNRRRERKGTLATLAAVGLGMAVLRKMSFRRYMMARMLMGGFGRRGYGPWSQHDFSQMPIPPFIDARLKTWHDQAHGNVTPSGKPTDIRQV